MKEAIDSGDTHHGTDIYGRTDLCEVWKTVFSAIDRGMQRHTPDSIDKWLHNLEQKP